MSRLGASLAGTRALACDLRLLTRLRRAGDWNVEAPARALDRLVGPRSDADRRAAVAALAASFPTGRNGLRLPASIRDLYSPAFERLARHLAASGPYDFDSYAKDLRLVLGLTVPAGAQDIDVAWSWSRSLPARIGRLKRGGAALTRLAATGDLPALGRFVRAGPFRPLLQIHTDSRWLEEFNPEGWEGTYRRAADLLELHPAYGGMIGLSWFYDPALVRISPRLAYLQRSQLDHGAVRFPLASRPIDVERATLTSETRRRLYETGAYSPRCWAIAWPRADLLAWAKAQPPQRLDLAEAA